MPKNPNEKSWQVFRRMFKRAGGMKVIAFDLHLSPQLIQKWQAEPPSNDYPDGSGARNPLDRLDEIRRTLEDAGETEAAVAGVQWLAGQAGYRLVRVAGLPGTAASVLIETLSAAKESGDISGAVLEALADGMVTAAELKAILKETGEAILQIMRLELAAKEAAGREIH